MRSDFSIQGEIMIYDTLAHLKDYQSVHPLFTYVCDFIATHDLKSLPLGKHQLNNNITLGINEYITRDIEESFAEVHECYIDLQIITQGQENVGVCPLSYCQKDPYNAEKDFRKVYGPMNFLTLSPATFMIFFPQDAHMPMLKVNEEGESVRKLVFKIPV